TMSSGSRARTHTHRVKLRSVSVLSSVRNRFATSAPSSPASPIASGSSRTQGGGSSRCRALATAVRTAVRLGRRGVTVNARRSFDPTLRREARAYSRNSARLACRLKLSTQQIPDSPDYPELPLGFVLLRPDYP